VLVRRFDCVADRAAKLVKRVTQRLTGFVLVTLAPQERGQFVALNGLWAAPRDVAQQDELFAPPDEQRARGPDEPQLTQRDQGKRGAGH
jgi:hypothetical protein